MPRRVLRRLVLAATLLGMLAPLAGCGFQPLYGTANTNAAGSSIKSQMANVRIEPIDGRLGQQLHNALRDRFNPLGQPADSMYSLEVNLTARTYGALARRDLSASRRNVELNAFYSLKDGADGRLMTDHSVITTGYDEFDDPLNDLTALEDAERRGTLQIADQIRTRIAVFLTAGTPGTAVPQTVAPIAAPEPPPSASDVNQSPSTSTPYSTAP